MSKTNPGATAVAEPESKTTYTKWDVFEKARRVPREILCQAYKPVHLNDESCHSRLLLDANAVVSHMEFHGGAFQFVTREGDKPWSGWKKLGAAGAEIHDFRCEVCDQTVPLTVRHIQLHSKPHKGKFRHSSQFAGTFNITLRTQPPLASGDDADEAEAFE